MNGKFKYKDIVVADAGYVINLEHRTDRKEKVDKLLNDLEFSGWEFYNGFMFEDPFWKKFGCTQSFLNIFGDALDKGYKSIVIFEDDIQINRNCKIDDFDHIFKSWDENRYKYDLIGMGTRPQYDSKVIRESNNFGLCTNCLCAHAWYYNETFINYVWDELSDFTNPESKNYRVVIDEFINDCCSHEMGYKLHNKIHRVGITIPLLFTQSPGFSDNENNYFNYSEWISVCYNNALRNGDEFLKSKNNENL